MPYGMADGSLNAWEVTEPTFDDALTVSDYTFGTLEASFACTNISTRRPPRCCRCSATPATG